MKSVDVTKSSGSEFFDKSVVDAIRRCGEFPELRNLDRATFESTFRKFYFEFDPGRSEPRLAADQLAYQFAFGLMKDGKYKESEHYFERFVRDYPRSYQVDSADYWLGDLAYLYKEYDRAEKYFQLVVNQYPDSRKVPDALLKIGNIRIAQKKYAEAREVLEHLVRNYGETEPGKLGKQRLTELER